MFSNISHLLQILHSVSTRDTGFLYHSQSKHILGTDRANHNIFTEQPVPNRWQSQHRLIQSINHRLRHWHHLQPSDSVRFWEFRAHWRTTLCVCSPHSCRALWWCRQRAPALTAKNMPGEKITREGGGANVENEGRWETGNAQMVYNIQKICIWSRSEKECKVKGGKVEKTGKIGSVIQWLDKQAQQKNAA